VEEGGAGDEAAGKGWILAMGRVVTREGALVALPLMMRMCDDGARCTWLFTHIYFGGQIKKL
jgi:hypothetical protein